MNAPALVPCEGACATVEFSINFENLDWWGTRSYTVNMAEIECFNGTIVPLAVPDDSLKNFTTTTDVFTVTLGCGEHHIVVTVTTDDTGKTYTADHVIYVTLVEDINPRHQSQHP